MPRKVEVRKLSVRKDLDRNKVENISLRAIIHPDHLEMLRVVGLCYQVATQTEVSRSLLIRRAIELLTAHATELVKNPALHAAEVEAINAVRNGGDE